MRARGLWVAVAVAGTIGAGLLFACGLDSGGTYAGAVDASIDQTTRDAPLVDSYVAPDVTDAGNPGVDAGDGGLPCEQTCSGACCNGTCLGGAVRDCAQCAGAPYFCPVLLGGTVGDCVSTCSQGCGAATASYDGGCVTSCEALGAFECGSTCVNSCDDCDGGSFGCSYCADGGAPVIAQCQPNASNCPDQNAQNGGSVCLCTDGDAGGCYGASQVCTHLGGPINANACLTCGQSGNGGPNTNGLACKFGGSCDTGGPAPTCH